MLSPKRVLVGPGLMQLTVTPAPWSIRARSREKMMFASFERKYALRKP